MNKFSQSKQCTARSAPPLFWSLAAKSAPKTRSLQHSASFPVYTNLRRPLPPTPTKQQQQLLQQQQQQQQQAGKQRHSFHAEQIDLKSYKETFVKREVQRRRTFHYYPSYTYKDNYKDDHIYEEIVEEDDSDEESVYDQSFLSLISSERRRNLRLYGQTDWDYGSHQRS